ncbi:hypothetical protein U1Q18_022996 [Sarracenia purpurea var. burkii]
MMREGSTIKNEGEWQLHERMSIVVAGKKPLEHRSSFSPFERPSFDATPRTLIEFTYKASVAVLILKRPSFTVDPPCASSS